LRKIPDTHWLIPDWRIPIRFYLADAICECIGGGFSGGRLGICDAESVGHAQFLAGFPEDAITTCGKIVQDNPSYARSHWCLLHANWAKREYAKVVSEWKLYAQ
jgi:hypothetical protein